MSRTRWVKRFIQISGIGADSEPPLHYIRARGEGAAAVRAAFAGAGVFRPAVMFGPDDAFLHTAVKLLRRLRLSDVQAGRNGITASVFVREFLRTIARALTVKPFLVPCHLGLARFGFGRRSAAGARSPAIRWN